MAAINENIQDQMNVTEVNISLDPEPTNPGRQSGQMSNYDDNVYMNADSAFEIKNRETIAKYAPFLGAAQSAMGSGPSMPFGFGHEPRPSTIPSKERKKRTAKKKAAKRSRKRNRH